MRKKIICFLAIFMMIAVGKVEAQNYRSWHENYHYDIASNLWWRAGAVYYNQLFTNKAGNVGLDVGIMKRVGNWLTLRELVQINGLKCTGTFDRYGKVMTGINIDFSRYFYLYGDIGAVYNRSIKNDPFGIALDAGIGTRIPLSNYTALFVEIGTDRVQNKGNWTSTPAATGGIIVGSGITDEDKYNIQILDNQPNIIEELSLKNKAAEEQVRLYSKTLDTMNRTLVEANNIIGRMRKEIAKCEAEKEDCNKNGSLASSDFPDINFGFGSVTLDDINLDKIVSIAEMMSKTEDKYIIYGFCSNDGKNDTNIELAKTRCYKVINLLEKMGIDSYRFVEIKPIGKNITYGEGLGGANRFVRIVKK